MIGIEIDDHIVGLSQIEILNSRYKSRHKVVLGIKILDAYTSKGYGRKLLEKIIEYVKENHYEMILLSVMEENKRAIHLYHSLGFEDYGRLEKAYKLSDCYQNEIFMVKYIENND